jgi:Ca2+/Na+ antiporter
MERQQAREGSMIRILIGSIVGGIVQFVVGFLFWGTPLSRIAFTVAPDPQNAAVQTALAQNLTATGTGTYAVPWMDTAGGAVLHGRGPVALIFFNTHGFPATQPGSLIGGLTLSVLSMILLGLALLTVADRVGDFASRFRIVALASVGVTLYAVLGQPTYNFTLPWGYWIYLAISLIAGFLAGGFVLARWFVPFAAARPLAAPAGTLH